MIEAEEENAKNETEMTLTKLSMSADYYASLSGNLSCFYMSQANRIMRNLGMEDTVSKQYCQYCGCVFRPENYRARFRRQMALGKNLRQLYRRADEQHRGKQLGKFQRHLLAMHQKRTNRMLLTCLVCKKHTVFPLPVREKIKAEEVANPQANLTKRQKRRLQDKRRKDRLIEKGLLSELEKAKGKGQRRNNSTDSTVSQSSPAKDISSSTSKSCMSSPILQVLPPTGLQHKQKATPTTAKKTNQAWLKGLKKITNKKKQKKMSHNSLQFMLSQSEHRQNKSAKSGLSEFLANIN